MMLGQVCLNPTGSSKPSVQYAHHWEHTQEQLTAATAAMVTQGNIEAEQEAERKRQEREARRRAEEEALAQVCVCGGGAVEWLVCV